MYIKLDITFFLCADRKISLVYGALRVSKFRLSSSVFDLFSFRTPGEIKLRSKYVDTIKNFGMMDGRTPLPCSPTQEKSREWGK